LLDVAQPPELLADLSELLADLSDFASAPARSKNGNAISKKTIAKIADRRFDKEGIQTSPI